MKFAMGDKVKIVGVKAFIPPNGCEYAMEEVEAVGRSGEILAYSREINKTHGRGYLVALFKDNQITHRLYFGECDLRLTSNCNHTKLFINKKSVVCEGCKDEVFKNR